jgi:hypothetical protein
MIGGSRHCQIDRVCGAMVLCCSIPVNCIFQNLRINYVQTVYYAQPQLCFGIYKIIFFMVTFCRRIKARKTSDPTLRFSSCHDGQVHYT